MKISTTSETASESSREIAMFLATYCARLLACGATCMRLEKNASRIAAVYGKDIEVTTMPRHVQISLWDAGHANCTIAIEPVGAPAISFDINTRLSRLSWDIADGKTNFAGARRRFDAIIHSPSGAVRPLILLVVLANAAFCRLFGGDPVAMGIVAVATFAGFYLKQVLTAARIDSRVVVAACAFVSAVLGATDSLFAIGTTPAVALGTSVLYLVPGIPLINSFSDAIYRHYLCALSRFTDAVVTTCCLSAGLCAAMLLMGTGMF